MGTKRGPSAAEKGTKRGLNGDLKSVYLINWPKRANSLKKIFVYKKSSPSVLSFSAQLGWGISINKLVCNQGFNAVVLAIRLPFTGRTLPVLLALYSGCTDFWRVLRPKMEKIWKKGDQKTHCPQSPLKGTNVGAVISYARLENERNRGKPRKRWKGKIWCCGPGRVREKYGASSLWDSSLWIKYHSDEYIKGEFLMDSKMEMTCTNQ